MIYYLILAKYAKENSSAKEKKAPQEARLSKALKHYFRQKYSEETKIEGKKTLGRSA